MSSPSEDSMQARALELFSQCLEHSSTLRYSWLAEQCAGDRALLEEVLKLVDADEEEGGFLDSSPPHAQFKDRSGERLGPWELLGELGAGGMGRVYHARRSDGAFEQEVAIKLFEGAVASTSATARFHAERQILASLEHPNIARLIDGGSDEAGTPYVVMELVRGHPITRYCDNAALDVPARLQLFQKVCQALEVAHRRGIVHRDIKPGNVLVDDGGEPKVIDFGIAKILRPEEFELSLPATRTHAQLLTPEYASPEQVRGQTLGATSDVYSLGVLLYEILTGTKPYQISTLTPAEVERTVCDSIPANPSVLVAQRKVKPSPGLADRRALRRILKGDLDRIVMTALRKEPDSRYGSAAAFGKDIERYLGGQPVAARGASKWYRARKFVSRHPGASGATALAFAILLVALGVISLQVQQARSEAARAEAARDFLIEIVNSSDPYQSAGVLTVAQAIKQSVPTMSQRFAGQPLLEAEMRHAVGAALAGQGEFAAAEQQLELAGALYELGGSAEQQASYASSLALLRWEQARFSDAQTLFEQALERLEGLDAMSAQRLRFDILSNHGGLAPHVDQPRKGIELLKRAQKLLEVVPDVSLRSRAVIWNNLATCYDMLEDYEQSIAAYEKSIALHRQTTPQGSPDLAIVLGNLGMTWEYLGDMDKAIAYLEEGVAMQRDVLGEKHPQYVLAIYNLGSLQMNTGDLEGAIGNMQAAVTAATEAYPPGHLYTGRFQHRLAMAYQASGRTDLARKHARRALNIYQANDEVSPEWETEVASLLINK